MAGEEDEPPPPLTIPPPPALVVDVEESRGEVNRPPKDGFRSSVITVDFVHFIRIKFN